MKRSSGAIALSGIMALFSINAFASSIPSEIFHPRGAEVVKAEQKGDGEFEAEFRLNSRQHSVKSLAKQVRNHAQRHGFRVVESKIDKDDADLKFKRRNQELDVSIEQKDHGIIEYESDLDLDRN